MFYIPPGTIHNTCAGNLIMEIISANAVITFRFYDYLIKGQQGKPRPLHIREAIQVLNPGRTTSLVEQYLKPEFSPDPETDQGELSVPQYGKSYTKLNKLHINDTYNGDTR